MSRRWKVEGRSRQQQDFTHQGRWSSYRVIQLEEMVAATPMCEILMPKLSARKSSCSLISPNRTFINLIFTDPIPTSQWPRSHLWVRSYCRAALNREWAQWCDPRGVALVGYRSRRRLLGTSGSGVTVATFLPESGFLYTNQALHPKLLMTTTIFTYVELAAEFLYDLPLPPPPPPSDTYPIAIHYQDAGIYGTDLFVQPFSVGSAGTSTTPVVVGVVGISRVLGWWCLLPYRMVLPFWIQLGRVLWNSWRTLRSSFRWFISFDDNTSLYFFFWKTIQRKKTRVCRSDRKWIGCMWVSILYSVVCMLWFELYLYQLYILRSS